MIIIILVSMSIVDFHYQGITNASHGAHRITSGMIRLR